MSGTKTARSSMMPTAGWLGPCAVELAVVKNSVVWNQQGDRCHLSLGYARLQQTERPCRESPR